MKTIYLFSALALFLAGCQDRDFPNSPTPDYKLISIQYDIREVIPEQQYVDGISINNETSSTITYSFAINNRAVFTSSFDYKLFKGIEFVVPIPRLDENGAMTGYSSESYPFESHQWEVAVDYSKKTCEVPGYSVFRMRITNLGFEVTADFTCEVIDRTTNKTQRLTGTWSGMVFTKQQMKTNINDKFFTEEYKPILY